MASRPSPPSADVMCGALADSLGGHVLVLSRAGQVVLHGGSGAFDTDGAAAAMRETLSRLHAGRRLKREPWTDQAGRTWTPVLRRVSADTIVCLFLPDTEEERYALVAQRAELARLEEQNVFKNRFLNMVAHELNTPITPLRLQMHLLKTEALGPLAESQRKSVTILDRNLERLAALVKDVLDVARLESGRLTVRLQPTRLDELAGETVAAFHEAARRVGLDLRYKGPTGVRVMADPTRITQVLYNLVSNAMKFTPEGGTVELSVLPHVGRVLVQVQDTGIGMTPEQMAGLFKPFGRVHEDQTDIAGTGLGLYITHGIVEAHGGTLSVQSGGPGKGSRFWFYLSTSDGATEDPKQAAKDARGTELAERIRELI